MSETVQIINISQQSRLPEENLYKIGSSIFLIVTSTSFSPKGLHAGPWGRDRSNSRERSYSNPTDVFGGTEATFRGKRRVTLAGRLTTGLDEGYRRLDPLPDRLQGRKIVVSPKPVIDDDKGKGHFK